MWQVPPSHERHVGEREAGAVVHRRDGDRAPSRADVEVDAHAEPGEHPTAVGQQDALGAAGRPRRVRDAERVELADLHRRVDRAAVGQERLVVLADRAVEGEHERKVVDEPFDVGQVLVGEEDAARP